MLKGARGERLRESVQEYICGDNQTTLSNSPTHLVS